ncbi:MAG: ribonuclease [Bacteroidota bacterium]|jgi:membrane protein|nr:ribonuclease [Bacteroidota bacterium]
MKTKFDLKKAWKTIKETFTEFIDDNCIKLSASLSYYTIFALPPLLIVIIALCGLFFGKEAVRGEIFWQINTFVGNDAASQIQEIIKNVKLKNDNVLAATIGVITLLMGATGIFGEIQSSINFIWGLKAKPNRGLIKFLKNRLMSFSMIGVMGFLLLVGLIINSIMDLLNKRLIAHFPNVTVYLFYVLNILLVFIIIAALFTVIFRTLPDGRVSLRDTIVGASTTAVLFMLGKFAIGAYLGQSTLSSTYGAAGSIIVILLWVYYSANILYLGAEFTKVYARLYGHRIIANDYAVKIDKEIHEIEPKVVYKGK